MIDNSQSLIEQALRAAGVTRIPTWRDISDHVKKPVIEESARKVCAELNKMDEGADWRVVPTDHNGCYLKNFNDPDDHKENFHYHTDRQSGGKSRIEISLGQWKLNKFHYGMDDTLTTTITVDVLKQELVIARDIFRRLLPDSREKLKRLRDRRDENTRYKQRSVTDAARLVVAADGLLRRSEKTDEDATEVALWATSHEGDWYIRELRVNGNDSVRMYLDSLPVELACSVVKALNRGVREVRKIEATTAALTEWSSLLAQLLNREGAPMDDLTRKAAIEVALQTVMSIGDRLTAIEL